VASGSCRSVFCSLVIGCMDVVLGFYWYILVFLSPCVSVLLLFVGLLVMVSFMTLLERKGLAVLQRRRGPDYVGFLGLLQPLVDGVKLMFKHFWLGSEVRVLLFYVAPLFVFGSSVLLWTWLPYLDGFFVTGLCDTEFSLLFFLFLSSLGLYGVFFSGWAGNSRYSLLGALRACAQFVSYEICLSFIVFVFIASVSSCDMVSVIGFQRFVWFWYPFCIMCVLFYIVSLAETNRVPFDLAEAESELVSGYNVEYGSMWFALFFLGEYANIILFSTLLVCLFFGVCGLFGTFFLLFFVSVFVVCFLFVWVRGTYPRYRYDQLMSLCWKSYIPLLLGLFVVYVFVIF